MSPGAAPIEDLARIQENSLARASESTRRAYPVEHRMDGAGLFAFLSRHRTAVLATVRPDGRPQAGPVGYALVGTRFVLASLESAARVSNLRMHPHVSLVVSEDSGRERAVVLVDGTARLVRTLDAAPEVRAPFRAADGSLPPWVEVFALITPERLLSYASDPASL